MNELARWGALIGLAAAVTFAGWTASRAARDPQVSGRLRGLIAALIAVTPPVGAVLYWAWVAIPLSSTREDAG